MTAMKATLIALATVVGLSACSTDTGTTATGASTVTVTASATSAPPTSAPPTTTESVPSPTATTTAAADSCEVNPSDAPLTVAEPYQWVPDVGRVSVTISGVPSGTVKPGDPPVEIEVTVCNDSAVSYPQVGVVAVLDHCSCAPNPMSIPVGTVEYFDQATGAWTPLARPAAGMGMDYLGQFANVQELPKGQAFTVKYRIALDASMTAGEGGVSATVVTVDPLNQIGAANSAFAVTP